MTESPYDERDADEVFADIEARLNDNLDDPATDQFDNIGGIALSVAETIANVIEPSLSELASEAYVMTATGDALDRKVSELGLERREPTQATGRVTFSRDDDAPTDFVIPANTRVRTEDGSITFETTHSATIEEGDTEVDATIRAVDGGTDANVPANKVVTMPSPPTGVEEVTNPVPVGDETETDAQGNTLVPGENRETDEELRRRALETAQSIGGAATPASIQTRLQQLDGVRSVTVFTNPKDEVDEHGLDPYSSEIIVVGGNERDVAEAIVDTVAVTELFRLQGGVIGTEVTEEVYVDVFDQSVDVHFSRPERVELSIEATVDAKDTFVGEKEIAKDLVGYVGGVLPSGDTTFGLDAGEDVYIDEIHNVITGSDTGVRGVADLMVDATGDGTDDREENEDGIDVISIDKEQQAVLDTDDVIINTIDE